jgi:hypothetical protein
MGWWPPFAVEKDKYLTELNRLSTLNRGQLYCAPSNLGIKRKLLKMMRNIHFPLIKELSLQALSETGDEAISLRPPYAHRPHLYLDQPFVILGETESADDFILFIQGRVQGKWLNIKKRISFLDAKKAGASLAREWELQQAGFPDQ